MTHVKSAAFKNKKYRTFIYSVYEDSFCFQYSFEVTAASDMMTNSLFDIRIWIWWLVQIWICVIRVNCDESGGMKSILSEECFPAYSDVLLGGTDFLLRCHL